MSAEAEFEFVAYYGGAKPGDGNYAEVVAVDADIIEVLAERERRRKCEAMPRFSQQNPCT